MPSSMVWRFSDPDEYVASVRATKMELVVTRPGEFAAKLIRIDFHRLWMQRFFETLPRVAHFDNVPGRAIFSFGTKASPPMLWCGNEIRPDLLQRHPESDANFQRSTGSTNFGTMSLPIVDMETVVSDLGGSDVTPPKGLLTVVPPPAAMQRLQRLHRAGGHLAEHAPEVFACPEAARGLEQALIAAMADCLCTTDHVTSSSVNIRHAKIMRKFFETLEANPDDVFHLPEMCKAIGVSNRTLTQCCAETLGVSPYRYLRLRQLNFARRALVLGDPATTTVTEIATAYGFWDLGRFAVVYRALFGERPSATLRRDRGAAPSARDHLNNLRSADFT